MQMAMQVAGSILIAVVALCLLIGAFFRLTQDMPMGFHTQKPGPEYDGGIRAQVEGQHRLVERWFRLWPVAVGLVLVAFALIAVS